MREPVNDSHCAYLLPETLKQAQDLPAVVDGHFSLGLQLLGFASVPACIPVLLMQERDMGKY